MTSLSPLDEMIRADAHRGLAEVLNSLDLSPGDRRRVEELAMEVRRQHLKQPYPFGTRLRHGTRGDIQIFVGSKPAGFEEDFQKRLPRRRDRPAPIERSVALVWTVDDASGSMGISQSLHADWVMEAMEPA